MTNTFWIEANIILDLGTGERRDVLMLASNERDASIFQTEELARNYLEFVANRAKDVQWFLDPPTPQRPQGWLIRGVQTTPT